MWMLRLCLRSCGDLLHLLIAVSADTTWHVYTVCMNAWLAASLSLANLKILSLA